MYFVLTITGKHKEKAVAIGVLLHESPFGETGFLPESSCFDGFYGPCRVDAWCKTKYVCTSLNKQYIPSITYYDLVSETSPVGRSV